MNKLKLYRVDVNYIKYLYSLTEERLTIWDGLTKITIKKAENSISNKPWGASASVIIEWTGE